MVLKYLCMFVPHNSNYNLIAYKRKMKNVLIKTGLVLALSLTFQAAKSNNGSDKDRNQAEKTIKESLNFRGNSISEQKVEILFSTGKSGEVNFVLAKTANELLKKQIEKQFSNMQFPQLKQDVVNSIVISFKIN